MPWLASLPGCIENTGWPRLSQPAAERSMQSEEACTGAPVPVVTFTGGSAWTIGTGGGAAATVAHEMHA
jgi:hypothetical protein